MARAVAFLRAINVGGHTVKMDHLRGLFESMGFKGVQTVIASGNVLFDSPRGTLAAAEGKIAAGLEKSLGYPVGTFIRTLSEVKTIAAQEPFGEVTEGTLYIGFLAKAPAADAQRKLLALASDDDRFHFAGREVYWLTRTGFAQSKVSGAVIEKLLGTSATLRNRNTVQRIADLV